jgi:tetratricopeptide (TPR) repeat protein
LLAAQRTDPGHESPAGETAFIVGAALQALSREAEAEASLREALRTNPAHRLAGIALAHLQRNQGRYRAAAATVEALVAAVPGDRNFALHAIGFLRDTPSPVEAERLWQSTRQDANSDPEASYVGGEIASMAVDFTAARTRFDHCLTLDPINPGALHARAVAGPLTRADAFAAHLERLTHDRQRLPLDSRIMLDFVLGKLAMDCGEMATAFGHFDRANAARGVQLPWNRAASAASACTSSPDASNSQRVNPHRGDDVVLVVGMPRSGKTLLASRLGQHPDIAERGESPWLGMREVSRSILPGTSGICARTTPRGHVTSTRTH